MLPLPFWFALSQASHWPGNIVDVLSTGETIDMRYWTQSTFVILRYQPLRGLVPLAYVISQTYLPHRSGSTRRGTDMHQRSVTSTCLIVLPPAAFRGVYVHLLLSFRTSLIQLQVFCSVTFTFDLLWFVTVNVCTANVAAQWFADSRWCLASTTKDNFV